MNIFSKKNIILGIVGLGITVSSAVGITSAINLFNVTQQQVKTLSQNVTYGQILASPDNGGTGYLVNVASFPANAEIISAYYKVQTPFATNEDPSNQAQTIATLNLYDSNGGIVNTGIANGSLTQAGYVTDASKANVIIHDRQLQLKLDVSNGSSGGNLTNLKSGNVSVVVNYLVH